MCVTLPSLNPIPVVGYSGRKVRAAMEILDHLSLSLEMTAILGRTALYARREVTWRGEFGV